MQSKRGKSMRFRLTCALIPLFLIMSACSSVPTVTMPPQLAPRPVTTCQPRTYREALACAIEWRNGWREAEADKAAAREHLKPTTE